MKRFLMVAILCLVASSSAQASGERILSFTSDITVNEDATLTVRETIRVLAQRDQINHGIYRDFPTLYQGKYGTRMAVDFRIIEVLRDGKQDGYHTAVKENGIRVYMGKKNVTLTPGEYTYQLTYQTDRQLGFFEDHDELYWNVTGNGWVFSVDRAEAIVRLPAGIPRDRITTDGYTGPQGAREKEFRYLVGFDRTVRFETTAPLGPYEGLTIVVGWPKGFVAEPTREQEIGYFLDDNLGTVVGLGGLLLLFVYYLVVWSLAGKDPAPGTIIPLFAAPEGLSPASVRYVSKMGYDQKAFAAALINMAVKRWIKIEENDRVYTIRSVEEKNGKLSLEEGRILSKLLGSSDRIVLKNEHHQKIQGAVTAVKEALRLRYEKVYFLTNRGWFFPGLAFSILVIVASLLSYSGEAKAVGLFMSIWLTGWSFGVFFLMNQTLARWREFLFGGGGITSLFGALFMSAFSVPFLLGEVFGIIMLGSQVSIWMLVVLFGVVAINCLFYTLLKAPTRAGRKVLDKIEGLKMYLGTAEKERLNALHPPERTPEEFEKFLPYALALDVEQQWSERFADVLAAAGKGPGQTGGYRPIWYTGGFTTAALASSIGGSLSGAISSSSTAPGSSSGGGGGGSSGGGGGGGGGGGW